MNTSTKPAITAYLDTFDGTSHDPDPMLYVARDGGRGPLLAITPRGDVEERFRLPDSAAELFTFDEVLDRVEESIEGARLSAAARREVDRVLRELREDRFEEPERAGA